MEETRRQGFARRHLRFGGTRHDIRQADDGLAALAVPIIIGAAAAAIAADLGASSAGS